MSLRYHLKNRHIQIVGTLLQSEHVCYSDPNCNATILNGKLNKIGKICSEKKIKKISKDGQMIFTLSLRKSGVLTLNHVQF